MRPGGGGLSRASPFARRSRRALRHANTSLVTSVRIRDDVRALAERLNDGATQSGALADRLRAFRALRKVRTASQGGASARVGIDEHRVATRASVASGGSRRGRAWAARVHRAGIRRRTRDARAATRAAHAGARSASGTPDLIGWAECRTATSAGTAHRTSDPARPRATAARRSTPAQTTVVSPGCPTTSIRTERCDGATTQNRKPKQGNAVRFHGAASAPASLMPWPQATLGAVRDAPAQVTVGHECRRVSRI